MVAHAVRLGSSGSLEIVRSAPPEPPDALRAAAARLRAGAGAGAVDVLAVHDDGERVEVVLAYAGRSPTVPLPAPEAARIAANTAARLADLHALGLAHGAVTLDHVLVDADGVVRLCGLRDGEPADDVLAFGALLRTLVGDDARGDGAEELIAIAARCESALPEARPTMGALAASLAAIGIPRTRATPSARVRVAVPTRLPQRVTTAALAVLALALGWLVVPRAPSSSARVAITPPSTESTTTTSVVAARVWPALMDRSWTFGDENDLQVLGDWDCDGETTPALVDASTGDVWVIDAWPAPGASAAARYVTTIDLPRSVAAVESDTCDAMRVERTDGGTITVSPARPAA